MVVEKLKRALKKSKRNFLAYVYRVGGSPRFYRENIHINYSDIRAIAKKLEGKTKSAFMRKAKKFFAMRKKLDRQITKAMQKPE